MRIFNDVKRNKDNSFGHRIDSTINSDKNWIENWYYTDNGYIMEVL